MVTEAHKRCSEGGLQLRRRLQLLSSIQLVVVYGLHNMESCWSEWAHYMEKRNSFTA